AVFAVERGVFGAGWGLAILLQLAGGGDQTATHLDDGGVGGAEMFARAVGDGAHAFLHGGVLNGGGVFKAAEVDFFLAFAIEKKIVFDVRGEARFAEPFVRVG